MKLGAEMILRPESRPYLRIESYSGLEVMTLLVLNGEVKVIRGLQEVLAT